MLTDRRSAVFLFFFLWKDSDAFLFCSFPVCLLQKLPCFQVFFFYRGCFWQAVLPHFFFISALLLSFHSFTRLMFSFFFPPQRSSHTHTHKNKIKKTTGFAHNLRLEIDFVVLLSPSLHASAHRKQEERRNTHFSFLLKLLAVVMSHQGYPVLTKQVDYCAPNNMQERQDERSMGFTSPQSFPPSRSQPQWTNSYQRQNSPPQNAAIPTALQLQQQGSGGGDDAEVPANHHANPADVPANLTATRYRHRPWHYSLCVLCKEMDSCSESCCCLCCQLSRQCNMFINNRREIHWPYCIIMTLMDLCTAHMLVTWIFASQTRRLSRERYGISGSCCSDCCVGCWCRICSTQQVLLEMTVMNDFPGATCYNAVPQPMEFEMV